MTCGLSIERVLTNKSKSFQVYGLDFGEIMMKCVFALLVIKFALVCNASNRKKGVRLGFFLITTMNMRYEYIISTFIVSFCLLVSHLGSVSASWVCMYTALITSVGPRPLLLWHCLIILFHMLVQKDRYQPTRLNKYNKCSCRKSVFVYQADVSHQELWACRTFANSQHHCFSQGYDNITLFNFKRDVVVEGRDFSLYFSLEATYSLHNGHNYNS